MNERKIQKLKHVFSCQSDYVPLGVNLKNEKKPYTIAEMADDPEKALANSEAQWKSAREIQSDIIPFVESNFLESLVPSIFGAKIHIAPGGSIDVYPAFKDIYDTESLHVDDIFNSEMEKALRHHEYLYKNAPDDVCVTTSRVMSPLDCAVVLRGGDFYMDLLAEPELALEFMNKICDVTIKVLKELKKAVCQPLYETITLRGFVFPGIRITGDAIVNISTKMIEETFCPYYKMLEKEFGRVMLHYCCTPAPSTHVIGGLIKGGGVTWTDNWQGYKTMVGENTFVTGMGICTDVKKEDILSGKLFEDEFFMFRKRPLAVCVNVDTVDEGKEVYEIWQEKMNKGGYYE